MMSNRQASPLHAWEKWPVAALMAAAGLNTALWYVGTALPPGAGLALPWLIVAAGIASVIAIDGALVATIAGMREGRRSRWSGANIGVTALFTGLAALNTHHILDAQAGAMLHGLFALTIVTYAMHLAQPRQDEAAALAARELELIDAEQRLASREQALALREQELSRREQELSRREQEVLVERVEVVKIATRALTWSQLEQVVRRAMADNAASMSSLRRLVAAIDEP